MSDQLLIDYLLLPEPDAQEETDESTLDRQAEATDEDDD
jgi:hypothetical protein